MMIQAGDGTTLSTSSRKQGSGVGRADKRRGDNRYRTCAVDETTVNVGVRTCVDPGLLELRQTPIPIPNGLFRAAPGVGAVHVDDLVGDWPPRAVVLDPPLVLLRSRVQLIIWVPGRQRQQETRQVQQGSVT